jgi:hypothetical protein
MTGMIFFSPSTCGAYTLDIHGEDIPGDVVEVALSDWRALLNELSSNSKKMGARADGYPILIDPPPPTPDVLAATERQWRDRALGSVEWLVTRHREQQEISAATTLAAGQFIQLLEYRRELRDWPQSEGFPDSVQRPTAPSWIAEQTQ